MRHFDSQVEEAEASCRSIDRWVATAFRRATAMARYGAEFPEVMRTAPRWNEQANARLYGRGREADDDIIVRYYSYVELGLESATPRWRRPRSRGSRPTS